jgi:predicted Rossmann fold flavoprotein
MKKYDAVILGAGAAGLFCAVRAGQLGQKVLVLERGAKPGAKILISGGGRCNFTNLNIAADRYISENPRFCLSALKSYTQHDFIELVKKYKIAYHVKTLGQLFCDGSAQQIIDMLLAECAAAQVDILYDQQVTEVMKPDAFHIKKQNEIIEVAKLVLATGGLSIPKMGATSFSYDLAQRFGLKLTETIPALVPLTFDGKTLDFMRDLSGVSLPVEIRCGKRAFREDMVFTHRGLSGPAILQISSYWRESQPITINLLPDTDATAFLRDRKKARPKVELKTALGEVLPQRLAQSLTAAHAATAIGTLTDKVLNEIAKDVNAWQVMPSGTEGYAKAEVTLGGISTHDLSSKTMEATGVPGLYAIGEAVDVTGWLGGYNFQWAWSSAWAAGSGLAAHGK